MAYAVMTMGNYSTCWYTRILAWMMSGEEGDTTSVCLPFIIIIISRQSVNGGFLYQTNKNIYVNGFGDTTHLGSSLTGYAL